MSAITTRSKAKNTDKRTISDTEIVKEVYSADETATSTIINDKDRPNKIRNIEKQDTSEAMDIVTEDIDTSSKYENTSRDKQIGSTSEPMETGN